MRSPLCERSDPLAPTERAKRGRQESASMDSFTPSGVESESHLHLRLGNSPVVCSGPEEFSPSQFCAPSLGHSRTSQLAYLLRKHTGTSLLVLGPDHDRKRPALETGLAVPGSGSQRVSNLPHCGRWRHVHFGAAEPRHGTGHAHRTPALGLSPRHPKRCRSLLRPGEPRARAARRHRISGPWMLIW